MKVSIHDWQEVNIKDIAQLTYEALQYSPLTRRRGQTVEEITEWLHTLEFDEEFTGSPVVVSAHEEGRLIGWLMLNTIGSTAEVVPWNLPLRPIFAPSCNRKEVEPQLVKKAVMWAQKEGVDVILLRVDKFPQKSEQDQNKDIAWYESLGFNLREDTMYLDYYITGDEEDVLLPDGFELAPVKGVDRDDLYQCYYDTFNAGQSPFFFDQTEKERREYFNILFESECADEDISLAILRGEKVVGFSFAKPAGTEGNVLLEWIGIHPDYRRRGRGEFLLRYIMKRVAQRGYATMSLSCAVGNTRAFNLYRKCGWEVEGGEIIFSLRI